MDSLLDLDVLSDERLIFAKERIGLHLETK